MEKIEYVECCGGVHTLGRSDRVGVTRNANVGTILAFGLTAGLPVAGSTIG